MGDNLPLIPQGRITDITNGAGPLLDSSGRTPYLGMGFLHRHFPKGGCRFVFFKRTEPTSRSAVPEVIRGGLTIAIGHHCTDNSTLRTLQRRSSLKKEEVMAPPDYMKILKLDKIAMKSKTHMDFLMAVKARLQFAKNLGVEASFSYFVEQAWLIFGDGT